MAPRSLHRYVLLGACALVLLLVCLAVALPGCQESPPPDASPPQIHRYPVRELDKYATLGGYLEDLDEGRVSLAPPVGWSIMSRDKDHVARFVFSPTGASPFPRITVDVRNAGFSAPRDATEEHLLPFFDRIQASLDQDSVQTVAGPQPLVLGQVPCVQYVIRKGFRVTNESGAGNRSFRGEREVIETLALGRIYSVILDTYEGKLEDYRADAYAVVAGLRFHQPQSTDDKVSSSSDGKQAAADGTGVDAGPTNMVPKLP
ncbi:MAG: hypothetical protein ACYC3X_28125 [Pirellulaceae bacterium]